MTLWTELKDTPQKLPTVKKIGNIIKTQEFNIENLQRIRNYITCIIATNQPNMPSTTLPRRLNSIQGS
jgi:hypothetical protein